MPEKNKICERLERPGIIAVVRAKSASQVLPLTEALVRGGIIAIEITMTTPNALAAIRAAAREFGSQALIGVGTVLDAETTRAAIDAGAQFVVSPITKPEIAAAAHQQERPCMLGAYSPTEAQLAHESGADYVKLFPAENLGPAYIKALRAPLPHLKIVPTGGVDLTNIAAFFQAGCAAVGVGSSLLSPKLLEAQNWPELTNLARQFAAAGQARAGF
jgi:2-dehydro-3-deoxyphosphogluconate aldolase/(4S)-4-hydroxy-2-oxoglutarate aldolase